ncbi:YigZ family protein [Paenibacillus chartarius]|uniref:YigZ family protein n=1 Tax=Paenibacillus chartarius TaxID=747481 RepID=A0ABV6DPD4_9BACL
MIPTYRTVQTAGTAEVVIKKSRFIGHCRPVQDEGEALRFIESIRKEHWSATHNCFAYVIGMRDEIQKQSDDGEPSGTAGKPILEVIKHQGLKNTVVVVTRYFGGIMLGAGGLIRAYTDGAVIGIEAAKPVWMKLHREVRVRVEYTWLGKVENELRGRGTLLGPTEYTDQVTVVCFPLEPEADAFIAWMTDLTQGQAAIEAGDSRYIPHQDEQLS